MNDAAVAWFVGILLTAIAAVYTAALVAFGVWFVREWIRENRRRRDWRVRLDRAQRDHDVRLLRVRHDPSATTEGGAS